MSNFFKRNIARSSTADPAPVEPNTLARVNKTVEPIPAQNARPDIARPVHWRWFFPRFNLSGIVSIIAVLTALLGTVLLILSSQTKSRDALLGSGLTFYVIAGAFAWFRIIHARNQSYIDTVSVVLAKSAEAREIWTETPGPAYLAKDPYFEATAFLGPTFVVVRDGTVEENGNEDETEAAQTSATVHNTQNVNIAENEQDV